MPVQKVPLETVVERLIETFRNCGFEGASLSKISESTGLVKASLYHHFPGGKEEMAGAVLRAVAGQFTSDVLAPLGEPGDPSARVHKVAQRLKRFYDGGSRPCLLNSLSLGTAGPVRETVKQVMDAWLDAFTAVAKESGAPAAEARRRAEDAIAAIEGSLLVARLRGDKRPFQRALDSLARRLTES